MTGTHDDHDTPGDGTPGGGPRGGDPLEEALRRALHEDADRVRPSDRLEQVLAVAHAGGTVGDAPTPAPPSRRRWLVPAAAAAAVALIGGGAVALSLRPEPRGDDVTAASPTTTRPSATSSPTTPQPEQSTTATPRTPGSTRTQDPRRTVQVSLPVYRVGTVGDEQGTPRLFRSFVPGKIDPDAGPCGRISAAVELSAAADHSGSEPAYAPFADLEVTDCAVTTALIRLEVSEPGEADATDPRREDTARVAVQGLVWTAQAALGEGNVPVRFSVQGDPDADLLGQVGTTDPLVRPDPDQYGQDLAPLAVTSPAEGARLPAGAPVTVGGEASTFEGNVAWELRPADQPDAAPTSSGAVTATAGAPARGTFSIALGRLDAGSWTVTVLEHSAEDGKVVARSSVTFEVAAG